MPEDVPPELATPLQATADRRGDFGRRILYFSALGSTNDEAARLAEKGAPQGTVVVAASQTAGRGRFGRTWFSPAGAGLYLSVVVRDRRVAPLLTLAGGVAVAEGIRVATGLPAEIKWPNDILLAAGLGRHRKVAGLLAEGSSGSGGLQHVVLGIGINIRDAAYPPEVAGRATSLETELGRPVDAGTVLAECLCGLAARVRDLTNGPPGLVLGRWTQLAPTVSGARVEWDTPAGQRSGTTAGIGEDGALLVRTPAGVERIVSSSLRWP